MKKVFFAVFSLFLLSVTANAQIMEDDFSSNQFGWTETSGRGGKAIIKDGMLYLEADDDTEVHATCYAPFDYDKPFVMSVDVLADKVSKWERFGVLFDYEDEQNYIRFTLFKNEAILERFVANKLVARKQEDLKLNKGKKIGLTIEVEYNLNELVFKVNGVKSLTYRRRVPNGEFLLGTSGIGFCAINEQKVNFDNLKIVQ